MNRRKDLTSAIRRLEYVIAERKKVDYALRDSAEKFKGLSEHSLGWNPLCGDKQFGYANPPFAEIAGYAAEELTGKIGQDHRD